MGEELERYNDPWSRLDGVIEALHKANINSTEMLGELKLVKQKIESMEMMHTLEKQVADKQIVRLEDNVKGISDDVASMKQQINRAQAVFGVIATLAMVVVGFVQKLIFDAMGGN